MTIVGAVFRPQSPPERLREVARAADGAGLDELWLWEDCFLQSGIASAAAALAWTERLEVGIGLLPVPLRNVALTAMEIATIDRTFPGRSHVAVGHGIQGWMGQAGARVSSPLTLLREHVTALRALLRGEEVTTTGRYVELDRVALGWPPARPTPIHVGASGPRSLRLAGEVADGTVLSADTSPAQVTEQRRLVMEGRELAGREDPHRITVYVVAVTGPDAQARLEAETGSGPGAAEELGLAGDAEAIATGVRRWAAAGADAVVLQPTAQEPDPAGFVRFVAEEVRPRVGTAPEPFVPADFSPPERFDHEAFQLRPLGPEHNERDHAAWMGSIDHIRATPGYPDGRWPQPMSLEQNLADLQRHHDHFRDRVGFTYTVLEARGPADRADVIGCVYLYPDDQPGSDVHVQSWVRADRADLDALLARTVRGWLEDAWPWRPERIRDHPRHTAG